MVERITINTYIENYKNIPLVDVRSPGEFEKGRIPGAFNIPLFSNDERAQVGTVYKQNSQEAAIKLGYVFVTPKLQHFIDESIAIAPNRIIAVHCWRGGMRSQSFAQHLSDNGFEKVYVIEHGYKAYRRLSQKFFEQTFKLKILGGYTGSGKTDILPVLEKKGEQVIDLEKLAHHKGSAFGSIGEKEQPSTEQFENNLFEQMLKLNTNKPIWLEDESISIGKVYIPRPLFLQMREQEVYFLEIPVHERAKYLVETYGLFEKAKLKESILKITKRIGNDKVKLAIEALKNDDLLKVAIITLTYYDKAYLKGLNNRDDAKIKKIMLPTVNAQISTETLLKN